MHVWQIPRLLFARLTAEEPDLRLCIAQSLSLLAGCYTPDSCSPAVLSELSTFLCERVTDDDAMCRRSALDWLRRVFPFNHIPARVACMQLAGDNRGDIKAVALQGLDALGKGVTRPTLTTASGGGSGDTAASVLATATAADVADAGASSFVALSESLACWFLLTPVVVGVNVVGTFCRVGLWSSGIVEACGLLHRACACVGCPGVDSSRSEASADADDLIPGMRLYPSFEGLVSYLASPIQAAESPSSSSPASACSAVRVSPSSRCTTLQCQSYVAAVQFLEKCLSTSAAVVGQSPSPWLQAAHDETLVVAPSGLASPLLMYQALLEFGLGIDPSRSDAAKAHEVGCSLAMPRFLVTSLYVPFPTLPPAGNPSGNVFVCSVPPCDVQCCVQALANLCELVPARLGPLYASRIPWLMTLVSNDSELIRYHVSRVIGTAAVGLPLVAPGDAATCAYTACVFAPVPCCREAHLPS